MKRDIDIEMLALDVRQAQFHAGSIDPDDAVGREWFPAGGDAEEESYAFKVKQQGATGVVVTAGNAYMVNETVVPFVLTELSVPTTEGNYYVYLRHTYGFGSAEGAWGDLSVCATASLPSELDGSRVVARNFIIATVSMGSSSRITGIVQNWRSGDIYGYAPYFAPEEGPAP